VSISARAVCFKWRVSSISASAPALIIATAKLAVVDDLLRAMNNGQLPTLSVGPLGGPGSGPDTYCPSGYTDCSPHYAPRPVIHPTPRYLPRPVIHPTPFYSPVPQFCPPPTKPDPTGDQAPVAAGPQAPWKSLPWQQPAKIPPMIKVVQRQPDIIRRGTLIDFFC
jgi:hypothetical protein